MYPKVEPRRWRVVLTADWSTLVIVNGDAHYQVASVNTAFSTLLPPTVREDAEMTQPPVNGGGSVAGVAPHHPNPIAQQAPAREVPRVGTVALIDDHDVIALGVTTMLAMTASLHFRGGYPSVAQLLEETAATKERLPDVVLLDLRLPDNSDPSHNARTLRTRGAAVIAYTSGDDPYLIRRACEGGVLGVVRKSETPDVLISTIWAALRGELTPSLDWASALDADSAFVTSALTPSEQEVLSLYATGAEASFVARQLSLSIHTVNTYVSRIRRKFMDAGVPAGSRVDLLVRAQAEGLVPTLDLQHAF